MMEQHLDKPVLTKGRMSNSDASRARPAATMVATHQTSGGRLTTEKTASFNEESTGSPQQDSSELRAVVTSNATGLTPVQTGIVLFSCLVGLFLSLMDASIVATAIYTIGLDLDSPSGANWVILGYMLAYVGFASVFTRFCDVVGRKWSLVAAYAIFLIMSLACGFCQSLNALIACRVLQGIGGAGLYSLTFVIFPEVVPPKLLPFGSSLIGMTVAVAGICGPILGGIISKRTSWRWIFWINPPVAIIPFFLFLYAWPNRMNSNAMATIKLSQVDFFGCFLMVVSSVLIVFGIQEAGVGGRSWSSPVIIATITVGLIVGVILVLFEYLYGQKFPRMAMIMPHDIMTDRVMLAVIFSTLFSGFSLFIIVFNIPLRFQIVNLLSSESAGIRMIALLGGVAVGTVFAGISAGVKNGAIIGVALASLVAIVGNALLSVLDTGFDVQPAIYGYQIVAGVGIGLLLATLTIMITLVSDFKNVAIATGLVTQARIFGGSIGIAASSAVFQAQCQSKLQGILTSAQIEGLQSSSETVLTLNVEQLNAVRTVFAESFNISLRICTYIAVAGFLVGLLCWRKNTPTMAERKEDFQRDLVKLIEESNAPRDGADVESGDSNAHRKEHA